MSQSLSVSDCYTSFFLAKNRSRPDFGYTTGTCAAAASCAAARMLVQQEFVPYVFIRLPEGSALCLEVLDAHFSKDSASCAV
ncbi:MAG: cobalt-precorrin-5B (C(1))-methyltransferase, partial [Treponema sp.]|nr:cobalt-precorrin-5B (C(1))-methyltransferase [Treponema sp.]